MRSKLFLTTLSALAWAGCGVEHAAREPERGQIEVAGRVEPVVEAPTVLVIPPDLQAEQDLQDHLAPGASAAYQEEEATPFEPEAEGATSSEVGDLTWSSQEPAYIPDAPALGTTRYLYVSLPELSLLRAQVEIQHTYVGDLRVVLTAPDGRQAVLHDREGGADDNLSIDTDAVSFDLWGVPSQGWWSLHVVDLARQDTGWLLSWGLVFGTADTPDDDGGSWDDGGGSWGDDGATGYGSSSAQPCNGVCWYGAHCTDYCPPGASCVRVYDDGAPYWEVLGCSW